MTEAKSTCLAFRQRSQLERKLNKTPPGSGQLIPPEHKNDIPAVFGGGSKVQRRSKRGFTYPGTLWLKACLRKVNDTSSRVVGQAFFNVIEVPCFELRYEDQCVERHWYGVCKKYGKVQVAVLRESKPYDFGGINVIDQLPIAPRVQNVPIREEGDVGDNTKRQTASGPQTTPAPGDPSLGNVISAAEDFIKVLATVSSSQSTTSSSPSSSCEASRGETESMDKKKRKRKKNKTARMNKDHRRKGRKGKGRKRKPTVEMVKHFLMEEAATTSCRQAEEVLDGSHFVKGPIRLREKQESRENSIMGHVMVQEEKKRAPSADINASDTVLNSRSAFTDNVKIAITESTPQMLEAQLEIITPSPAPDASTHTPFKSKRLRSHARRASKKRRKITAIVSMDAVTEIVAGGVKGEDSTRGAELKGSHSCGGHSQILMDLAAQRNIPTTKESLAMVPPVTLVGDNLQGAMDQKSNVTAVTTSEAVWILERDRSETQTEKLFLTSTSTTTTATVPRLRSRKNRKPKEKQGRKKWRKAALSISAPAIPPNRVAQ
ncbi:hypothetical protein GJAV_G00059000 [Gymnothorax javanicus]|nr:hypothetical protein GJAV_G00059000 [Gymnothorax javanicus]